MGLVRQPAAMSCQRRRVRWHGIYGCGFICPFFLIRNQGFDEVKGRKNQGRHQRPAALGGRLSAMSAVARAPSPVERWRSHSWWTLLSSLDIIADLIRKSKIRRSQSPAQILCTDKRKKVVLLYNNWLLFVYCGLDPRSPMPRASPSSHVMPT